MPGNKLDLMKLKASTYDETDFLAAIMLPSNTLANLEVFVNRLDGQPDVSYRGEWIAPESLEGFQKFVELPPNPKNRNKTLFDPLTKQMVDLGMRPDEFEKVRKEWQPLLVR